jgi:hypothetical protein
VDLYLGQGAVVHRASVATQELAYQGLHPGIDVSAIESGDASLRVKPHVLQHLLAPEGSMTSGKLPATLDQARNRVLWCQMSSFHGRQALPPSG